MMTGATLFVIGTACRWLGVFLLLKALIVAVRWKLTGSSAEAFQTNRVALLNGALAAILLLVSGPLLGKTDSATFFVPLVWFVMPFAAWMVVVATVLAIGNLLQLDLAIRGPERRKKLIFLIGWSLIALLFAGVYRLDPTNQLLLLKGGIPLGLASFSGLCALAVITIIVMGMSARAATSRGYAKSIAAHIALVVGSIVFGLPFLWLVITSFKEDRDMSSSNGIVWIPKVQDTLPYRDPKNPLLQGTYKGQTIQAEIQTRNSDGTWLVNVLKPQAIAGASYTAPPSAFKVIDSQAPIVEATFKGTKIRGMVVENMPDGRQRVKIIQPPSLAGQETVLLPSQSEPVRHVGLKVSNYPDALDFLPPETNKGLVYLKNTLTVVILSVIGTILSSAIVAYAFSRMRFPGKEALFQLLLSTMMLPAAVTMLPKFLIFRNLGWVDTLNPLWVPAFFASAFNVFLLRQFLSNIPMELEDAAKIDGCSYFKTFWSVMMPQIKPALAVIGIWTFMGAWNDFMGPLIYISSPEHMTISYAVQMFNSDRGGEPGMLMAFTTLAMLPVLMLFLFAQRYFIDGVTLSGLGGR